MRKTLAQSCTVVQRDDHEISHDNGASHDNPVCTQSILAMQKVFASPPLEDTTDPPRGRYFSYSYGPQIKVIVVDCMTLDRSLTRVGDDGMSPEATFFGADQLAWIKGLLLGPECLKIIVAGKTPLGDSPRSLAISDLDKMWAYGAERDELMDFITQNTTTTGAPINCEWWGGDRHAVGYLAAANNPLGRVSIVLSSGFSMHSLKEVPGESYEYVQGFSPTGTGQVIQWMQLTLQDDGAGTITRTVQPRVTDCSDRSAPLGHGWVIGDGAGGPFIDTWSYA
jgi:phosphodiesterase/alkaline phosphatase D-like protein